MLSILFHTDVLILSSSGTADEGTGPWILTISVASGRTATNDIDIELNVVLDEGKKLFDELCCADTIPMYGVSPAISLYCDYPCSYSDCDKAWERG